MTAARKPTGEVSLELAGVVVVAALLVCALLAAAPGWAGDMKGKVRSVVCSVVGPPCVAPEERRAGDEPAVEPTTLTAGPTAKTYGGGLLESPVVVRGGQPARCATVVEGEDGRPPEQVCLADSGPDVGYCRQGPFDTTAICKAAEVPVSGPDTRCADDPETPDPGPDSATPKLLLCQIAFDDEAAGSALIHCTPTAPGAGQATCENTHALPPLFPDGGPVPEGCFGSTEPTPLIDAGGGLLSTTRVTLCATASGAVAVCTITTDYAVSSVQGRIEGIDDFAGLAAIAPAHVRADCSQSLLAGVEKRLDMECSEDDGVPFTATCTLGNRRLRCAVFEDRDGRPTYHHCQDLERLPAAGACEPGNTLDANCPVEPDASAEPDASESCEPDETPGGSARHLAAAGDAEAEAQLQVYREVCAVPAPKPKPGRAVAAPVGAAAAADGTLLGGELVPAARATGPVLSALRHERAVLATMRCGFAIDGIDGQGTAPKLIVSGKLMQALSAGHANAAADVTYDTLIVNAGARDGLGALAHETTHMLAYRLGVPSALTPRSLMDLTEVIGELGSALVARNMAPNAAGFGSLDAFVNDPYEGPFGAYRLDRDNPRMRYSQDSTDFAAIAFRRFFAGALVEGLAPLVAAQATYLPAGCDDHLSRHRSHLAMARWFAESLHEIVRTGGATPSLATLCEALVTTGTRRRIPARPVSDLFGRYGIACNDGHDPGEL